MTQNSIATAALSTQDKQTLRTAAYGAVTLMSYAGVASSAHRVATDGTLALASATGLVGHVLAEKTRDIKLHAKSGAALADQVLPALSASVALLQKQDPAEAGNFRRTIAIAIEAAAGAQSSPTMAEMSRKITAALN